MRLGIFGGSFDPPHVGHLLAAHDAVERLALDLLVVVPAAIQPLKRGDAAPAAARLEMTRLTFAGDPRLEVSSLELDRGGVSFTVDTLEEVARRHPAAERFLLLGADVLSSFAQWRAPERVLALARPVILARAGTPVTLPAGLDAARLLSLDTRRIDVSSTEIRERVRAGRSIRGFVTDAVAALIERDRLYR